MAMRPGADNIEPAAGGEEKGIDFTLADAKLSDVPKSDTSSVALGSGVELQFGPDESVYPPTKQERLQEFVDGFGRVGKLYSDSVQDRGRFSKFQERMGNVYSDDRETFMDLARVGEGLTKTPPSSPEDTGKSLAVTLADAFERKSASGSVDLASPEMQNLEGAVAGMMLAARSNFSATTMADQTKAMVDGLDAELQRKGVPYLRGIVWGDNGEPGLAVVPPGQTIDRHKYLP